MNIVNRDFDTDVDIDYFVSKHKEFRQRNTPVDTAIELSFADEAGDTTMDALNAPTRTSDHVANLRHAFITLEQSKADCLTHFSALFIRNLANNALNPGIFGIRLAIYLILSLMIGFIFLHTGDNHEHSGANARISLCFGPAAFFVFLTVAALPFFMIERGIFEKELRNSLYSFLTYSAARTVAAAPGLLLIALLTSLFVVLMPGIDNYGTFSMIIFFLLLVGE
jgi:hypothetical protein